MQEKLQQQLEELKQASPLETTRILREIELYDAKSSQEIVDEVYEQFKNGQNITNNLIKPVFMAVADGLLEGTSVGRSARKKGLTASRVVQECEDFRYDAPQSNGTGINSYIEFKNARDVAGEQPKSVNQKYDRSLYEDKPGMDRYKAARVQGEKTLTDEYTGKKNLYDKQNNPNQHYNDPTHRKQAQTDHIVPLKEIHEKFKGNYALTDADIKAIANQEGNLAVTSAEINQTKKEKTNREYLDYMDQNGTPVDAQTAKNMHALEKEAKKNIDRAANQAVIKNLKTDPKLALSAAGGAASQAKNEAVGNLVLFILKPLYYEIKDIFKNGMKKGVNASSVKEALKIRFGRLKQHITSNAKSFFGDSILGFVKGFISSLVEGIIGLFVGIFRKVLRVLKEGFLIFVRAAKILFGKGSSQMSPAQKGDAIIKMIGASVIAIAGIGLDLWLESLGLPRTLTAILSTMLSGIASALFMYLLDRMDLFSVRAEQRRDRILEIFNERIKDIDEAAETCNTVAIEKMSAQRQEFELISADIKKGMKQDDIDQINAGMYKMAHFMNVDLPYSNTKEFCDYMESEEAICL